MTGGFQCYIRGIPINIQQTLQQYYNGGTFKDYLQQLGLVETYDTADELVVTLQSEDNNEDADRAYLATGFRSHQYWVQQIWDQSELRIISAFFDPKLLNQKDADNLVTRWKDVFAFDQPVKYAMYAESAEWSQLYSV